MGFGHPGTVVENQWEPGALQVIFGVPHLTSPRDGDRGPCTVYKLEPVTWGRIPPCGSMRRRSGWDYPFQESHERREANVSPISRP